MKVSVAVPCALKHVSSFALETCRKRAQFPLMEEAMGFFQQGLLALRRIAARVRQGGHDVPRRDVVRRFSRSWENFERIYRPLANSWAVYDNSGPTPQLLEKNS